MNFKTHGFVAKYSSPLKRHTCTDAAQFHFLNRSVFSLNSQSADSLTLLWAGDNPQMVLACSSSRSSCRLVRRFSLSEECTPDPGEQISPPLMSLSDIYSVGTIEKTNHISFVKDKIECVESLWEMIPVCYRTERGCSETWPSRVPPSVAAPSQTTAESVESVEV